MWRGISRGARWAQRENAEATELRDDEGLSLRAIAENFSGCRALELFTAGSSIFGGHSPQYGVRRQRDTYTGRAIKAAINCTLDKSSYI